MKPYDDTIDYCGANDHWTRYVIPRFIIGVDINMCCYRHDCGYELIEKNDLADEGDRLTIDKSFYLAIKDRINARFGPLNPRRYVGLVVARMYYRAVRLGGEKAIGRDLPADS